jgi:hypothetical protein
VAVLSDGGGGDQGLLKTDESGVTDSSRDGGTGEYAARMEGAALERPSYWSKGTGLRAKRSAIGSGWGGNAGTGGGRDSLDTRPLREFEGEREPRPKKDFFFLTDASER